MNPFADRNCVCELSEKEIIERICGNFGSSMPPPPFGAGDDCALIKKSLLRKNLYATSDAVIYGRHFDSSASPRRAGVKLMKRNISDIASMGASPFAALTSSIFSKNLSLEWLDEFCFGLASTAEEYGIKLIGGDLAGVEKDFFSMHLTLLGDSSTKPLLRSGAGVGDWIYVTGVLGRSFESGHHLDFQPRLREGIWLGKQKCVRACTDLSDGLGQDLRNIISSGEISAEIFADSVPLRAFTGGKASLSQALCDGEDYELLFAVRGNYMKFEKSFFAVFGYVPFRIGRIVNSKCGRPGEIYITYPGVKTLYNGGGFSHF